MEYWFVLYKIWRLGKGQGDLCNTVVRVNKDESPNTDYFRFVDIFKEEVKELHYFSASRVLILDFHRVNREDS